MSIKSFFKRPLIQRLSRLLLVTSSILITLLGLTFLYFFLNKEAIKEGLLKYVQDHQQGEIIIGEIGFSPLFNLPDLGIRLDSVRYYEHLLPDRPDEERPILKLDRVYVAFDILPLLSGNYDISEISLAEGDVYILSYRDHSINLFNALGIEQVKKEKINVERPPPPDMELHLEEFSMEHLNVFFLHEGLSLESELKISELSAGFHYKEGVDEVRLNADLEFVYLDLKERRFLRQKELQLDLELQLDEVTMQSQIKKSKLIFQGLEFDMSGTYTFDETGMADLKLDASDEDLTLLSYLIEDEFLDDNLELLKEGNLDLTGSIKGHTRHHLPEIEFQFQAENISIDIPGQKEGIRDLGFSASFSTGENDNFSEAELHILDLKGALPGGRVAGTLNIFDFSDPRITAFCEVNTDLKGWDKVFKIGLRDLSGRVALAANIEEQRLADSEKLIEGLDSIRLDLSDVSFQLPGLPQRLTRLNGILVDKANRTFVRRLSGQYGASDLKLKGTLYNAFYYLFNGASGLKADLLFESRNIVLNEWPFWDALALDPGESYLKDLKGNILFQSGAEENLSAAKLTLQDLRCALGDPESTLDLDLELRNFQAPIVSMEAVLNRLDLETWGWLLRPAELDSLSGNLTLTTAFEDWQIKEGTLPAVIKEMKLDIEEVFVHHPLFPYRFEALNGLLRAVDDQISLEEIRGRYGSSALVLKGALKNLGARLAGQEANLEGAFYLGLDVAPWNKWPLFDTLSKGIAKEQVTSLELDLSLKSKGAVISAFPWAEQWQIDFRTLKGDFDLIPDIKDLDASLTLGLVHRNKWNIDIDHLDLDLAIGRIQLKGGQVQIGEGVLYADTDAFIEDLQSYKLPEVFTPTQEHTPPTDTTERIQAYLPLKGYYHFESKKLEQLEISGADLNFQYSDSNQIALEGMNLFFEEIVFNNSEPGLSPLASIDGMVEIGKLSTERLENQGVRVKIEGRENYYFFKGSLYQFSEVREEGLLEVDLNGKVPVIRLKYDLEDFPVEFIIGKFYPEQLISGPVDVSLSISTEGKEAEQWILNADGELSVEGHELVFHGVDLDELLVRFRRTQQFNLIDIGAVFLAGPFGAVVTKGMDFGQVFNIDFAPDEQTEVPHLFTLWAFKNGIVTTRDAAFVTRSSRIAIDGLINMRTDSIDHLTVAVVDRKGCSLIDQTLSGPYDQLQTGKLKVVGTLLGSVINVLELITDQKCQPFYSGKVDHPK